MRKEFKIGIAGIAALLILFFGINYLKGINMFQPESYYYIEFKDINGLAKSSPVFASGYKMGIVNNIQYNYNHPGHVVVCVETDDDMRIPSGSHAELITDMLGTVKMNLILNAESKTYCHEGDTLPGYAKNGLLGAAETDLLPKIQVMLPKMDSILSSLNTLLADPTLKNTLHNTEQLTTSLNNTSKQLNRLMNTEVPQLASNMNAVSANLKTISDNLKNIDYAATFKKVDATLSNVRMLTDKLNRKDNSLGLLLNDSSLYNNLNATTGNAANLLEDLKEHPKRYVHFSLFGKKDK